MKPSPDPFSIFAAVQLSVGCVRAKFAKHIAILILVDATASALGFYLFGYAFAYGDEASEDALPAGNAFIGKNFFAMHMMSPNTYYTWVFQWTVRLTSAAACSCICPCMLMPLCCSLLC